MTDEYKSLKSHSTFTVTGEHERAFITLDGADACKNLLNKARKK